MRVKMRTTIAGPDLSANAGDVVEVSGKFGQELVKGGYAEALDAPKAAGSETGVDQVNEVETTDVGPAETATAPAQRRNNQRK